MQFESQTNSVRMCQHLESFKLKDSIVDFSVVLCSSFVVSAALNNVREIFAIENNEEKFGEHNKLNCWLSFKKPKLMHSIQKYSNNDNSTRRTIRIKNRMKGG